MVSGKPLDTNSEIKRTSWAAGYEWPKGVTRPLYLWGQSNKSNYPSRRKFFSLPAWKQTSKMVKVRIVSREEQKTWKVSAARKLSLQCLHLTSSSADQDIMTAKAVHPSEDQQRWESTEIDGISWKSCYTSLSKVAKTCYLYVSALLCHPHAQLHICHYVSIKSDNLKLAQLRTV